MKVLVCDDHTMLAEGLATRLRARGHDVRVHATPEDAVRSAAASLPHLCLMDVRFPGRPHGGLDALPHLRRVSPETIVLMLSAGMTPAVARAAKARGARGVASKDISLAALERAVEAVASGRPWAPSGVVRDLRSTLTTRELEVLDLVALGASTSQIGASMRIAPSTVRGHLEATMQKLDVHTRVDAAGLAGRVVIDLRDDPSP